MTNNDSLLSSAESSTPTPYAVNCFNCNNGNLVYMTVEFYMAQLTAADLRWICPRCFENAIWNDENYEEGDWVIPDSNNTTQKESDN